MQRYFQERTIRRQVQRQLERHAANTKHVGADESPDAEKRPRRDDDDADGERDLEKASHPHPEAETDKSGQQSPSQAEDEEEAESVEASRRSSRADAVAATASPPPSAAPQGTGAWREGGSQRPGFLRALSRQSTRSVRSTGTRLGRSLTGVHARDRRTHEGGERDEKVFVVDFEGDDDPLNPHNWPRLERIKVTILVASVGIIVGIASAIDSSVLHNASKEFGVSIVAESLATGIYLIGFGVGALVAAPFSETFGRFPVYIVTMLLFIIWVMASALAPNLGAQLVFRFFAGFSGATPLVLAGGSMADLWNGLERTLAFPIFANAAFTGPVLGPVMGGWIAQAAEEGKITWRWSEWTSCIGGGLVLAGLLASMPETFASTLLQRKAKHLRDLTGDQRYRAAVEIKQETFAAKMARTLGRPFRLALEPIVIAITLYLTVVYIVLFTFLDGYEYIFTNTYGTSPGITGTIFIGIIIGLLCGTALVLPIYRLTKRDIRQAEAKGMKGLQPESRLWYSMLGGAICIPISLFWMGWTARPDISIWSPTIASVMFGFGILCVFITSYQYIIDSYEVYAASALSFMTLVRYVISGAFVVIGIPMYENLGVAYTLTILGCLAAALAPLPYLFYFYGPALRKRSKYAAGDDGDEQ